MWPPRLTIDMLCITTSQTTRYLRSLKHQTQKLLKNPPKPCWSPKDINWMVKHARWSHSSEFFSASAEYIALRGFFCWTCIHEMTFS